MPDPVPYSRRSPFEHVRDLAKTEHDARVRLTELPPVTTWHVMPDGVHIWTDGVRVAVIPRSSFGNLMYELAKVMRSG